MEIFLRPMLRGLRGVCCAACAGLVGRAAFFLLLARCLRVALAVSVASVEPERWLLVLLQPLANDG
jgi:hypothetical protein